MNIEQRMTPWVVAALISAATTFATTLHAADYSIVLRPAGQVTESVVRIHDIADITGPQETVRQKLGNLDIDDSPEPGSLVKVSATQVRIRLRLLGIPDSAIDVRGTEAVVGRVSRTLIPTLPVKDVEFDATKPKDEQLSEIRTRLLAQIAELAKRSSVTTAGGDSPLAPQTEQVAAQRIVEPASLATDQPQTAEERVAHVAIEEILARLPWDREDVVLTPTHVGIRTTTRKLAEAGKLTAELKSAWPPLGRVQIVVRALDSDSASSVEIPVVLNVQYFQNVIVSARPITQGHLVTREDIYIDRREVRDLAGFVTDVSTVVGLKAYRPIGPLQVIRPGDVRTGPIVTIPGKPIIKRGQTVRLTADGGPLSISVAAEAQQDGRVGDVIRLKNADSGKLVTGTVNEAGEVEVSF